MEEEKILWGIKLNNKTFKNININVFHFIKNLSKYSNNIFKTMNSDKKKKWYFFIIFFTIKSKEKFNNFINKFYIFWIIKINHLKLIELLKLIKSFVN